jgi:hypothetical protein
MLSTGTGKIGPKSYRQMPHPQPFIVHSTKKSGIFEEAREMNKAWAKKRVPAQRTFR